MVTVHAGDARCFVYSYKEGLFAKLSHDLKLEVTRIELTLGADGMPTYARFFAPSIALVCRMKDGVERPDVVAPADRARILASLKSDVLDAERHPEIVFAFERIEPAGEGYRVRGALTLRGTTRVLETTSRREGDRQIAEMIVHLPDFGIAPFSAMLGALRVKADVRVRVEIPVTDDDGGPAPLDSRRVA